MASPQVAGGAALLKQQHPSWTVAQIKSALVQTADPVRDERGREVSVLREGGGLINLPRALQPAALRLARPAISFPVNGGSQTVAPDRRGRRRRARGRSKTQLQGAPRGVDGRRADDRHRARQLAVSATVVADARSGARHRLRVLTHGARHAPDPVPRRGRPSGARRRARSRRSTRPGVHKGTTQGAPSRGRALPLPDRRRHELPGPRGRLPREDHAAASRTSASSTLSGHAVPHVVYAGDENHLAGYAGLPIDAQPVLRDASASTRSVAGAVLPVPGTYDIVFDTRGEVAAPARSSSATG